MMAREATDDDTPYDIFDGMRRLIEDAAGRREREMSSSMYDHH